MGALKTAKGVKMRSHYCTDLSSADIGKEVTLCGWVNSYRDHGGVIFLDLRDRTGLIQIVCDPADSKSSHEAASHVRDEYVLRIKGKVRARGEGLVNPRLKTGEIEVVADEVIVENPSETLPFVIGDESVNEDIRLKYRFLDLRNEKLQNIFKMRSKAAIAARNSLDKMGFIEFETPILTRATPEGARDYLVPSRVYPGQFYALPQSPQLFKQLLMCSGFDKYFQIAKCFRDEDLRADRQPEFTQIDCEMAFVEQEDVMNVFEGLAKNLLEETTGKKFGQFPRMTFAEAMRKYGNDKPDIRFGMEFVELNDLVKGKEFKIFDEAELVVGINVEGKADYTRKQIDELIDWVKRPQIGASGMVWVKFQEDGVLTSSVNKFYNEADLKAIAEKFNAQKGDLILIMSGDANKVRAQLSALRMELGNRLGLRKGNEFAPLWVVDFPLLEWDEESGRYHAMHHPFTSPKPEDIPLLETSPEKVRANAYDLVLNGNEIGGGSIRIYDKDLQSKMFALLGFSPEEAEAQFGFLMNAFRYGAPPHGGLAFGFDRLVAILDGNEVIRDYIAFPKNNSGRDVMIDAPSQIDEAQLVELNISIRK